MEAIQHTEAPKTRYGQTMAYDDIGIDLFLRDQPQLKRTFPDVLRAAMKSLKEKSSTVCDCGNELCASKLPYSDFCEARLYLWILAHFNKLSNPQDPWAKQLSYHTTKRFSVQVRVSVIEASNSRGSYRKPVAVFIVYKVVDGKLDAVQEYPSDTV